MPVEKPTELKINGNRNVTAGGDLKDNVIVTGDGNTITIQAGATATEVVAALRQGGLLPRVTTQLPEAAFVQLLGLVETITLPDVDSWFHCYRACLPVGANLMNSNVPALLLTDLCLHPLTKRWPPLLEFVERLALADAVKGVAPLLRAWVDANADQVMPPVPVVEIERLRTEVRAEQQRSAIDDLSYLQIYLEPDLFNRTQQRKQPLFKVELVLWSAKTGDPLVLQVAEATGQGAGQSGLWRLDDLPLLLDRAFANRDYIALIPNIKRLLLEVVAPADLLCYGFERWQRNQKAEITYGIQHPLVVRLLDRLTIPNPADQALANAFWEEKWRVFDKKIGHNGFDTLPWLAKADLDNCLLTMLDLQNQEEAVCVGMAVALVGDKRDVFDMLRDAGIPVALWLRGERPDHATLSDLKDKIAPLLTDKKLADLRKAVHDVRRSKAAMLDAAFIGNALTLLWDDFTRPPYKYAEQGVFQ